MSKIVDRKDGEMIRPEENESRASYMLRVAAAYIRKHWPDGEIEYDETTCDGYCVADDCESAAQEV